MPEVPLGSAPNPDISKNFPNVDRREFLASIASALGIQPFLTAEELPEKLKEEAKSVEIVNPEIDGKRIKVGIRIERIEGDKKVAVAPNDPLSPGLYKLYLGSAEKGYFAEARYEVVDGQGKIVEFFPKTHVPLNNVLIQAGQRLRVTTVPMKIDEKPYTSARTFSKKNADDVGEIAKILRMDVDGAHHFGVTVLAKNMESGKEYEILDGSSQKLSPGTYQMNIFHNRRGFPQAGIIKIIDPQKKDPVEHAQVFQAPARFVIEKGERLEVVVPPAIRPYNSSFFRIGNTEAAVIFPRPYPILDFERGKFNGSEPFNSVQLAMAFWGMKLSAEKPEMAKEIRDKGRESLRPGAPVKNPEWVLGARKVAQDLAKAFVHDRKHGQEDYRGNYHASFLLHLPANRKLPADIASYNEAALADLLEQHLLWMLEHNVHRVNEGGGYANKSFAEDFEEGKDKAKKWPEICVQSTDLYRALWLDVKGMKSEERFVLPQELQVLLGRKDLNKDDVRFRLRNAIGRETWVYDNYLEEGLKDAEKAAKKSVKDRREDLKAWAEEEHRG